MERVALIIAFCAMMFGQSVFACEDCNVEFVIGLEETAQKADLIIIGRKIAEYAESGIYEDWPYAIDIQVLEILKGDINQRVITAESFTAECEYGVIILDDNTYVIMLKKDGFDKYDAINYNCGVTTIPVQDEQLLGYDMNVDEFVEMIGGERELIGYEELSGYNDIWIVNQAERMTYILFLVATILILGIIVTVVAKVRAHRDRENY